MNDDDDIIDAAIAEARRLGYLLGFEMPIQYVTIPERQEEIIEQIVSTKPTAWPEHVKLVKQTVEYIMQQFNISEAWQQEITKHFCDAAGLGEYDKYINELHEKLKCVMVTHQ